MVKHPRIATLRCEADNPHTHNLREVGAMSDSKGKDKDPQPPPATPDPAEQKRTGRVGFDERGNSVWEWQLDTGVYSRDVNTQKLKKLNLDELSIADTGVNKRPPGAAGSSKDAMPGGGFNPYNSSPRVGGGSSPYDTARALGDKLSNQPPPTKPKTPDEMRKLDEWIKTKRRLEEEQKKK